MVERRQLQLYLLHIEFPTSTNGTNLTDDLSNNMTCTSDVITHVYKLQFDAYQDKDITIFETMP